MLGQLTTVVFHRHVSNPNTTVESEIPRGKTIRRTIVTKQCADPDPPTLDAIFAEPFIRIRLSCLAFTHRLVLHTLSEPGYVDWMLAPVVTVIEDQAQETSPIPFVPQVFLVGHTGLAISQRYAYCTRRDLLTIVSPRPRPCGFQSIRFPYGVFRGRRSMP